MKYDSKGGSSLDRDDRQAGNTEWWTDQTMSYDWKSPIKSERYTAAWFDESDARFLYAARLFTGNQNPFVELMDTSSLAGKRVIEIGCGMGFHTEMLARAGAVLTSIDISPTSVEATRRRLELRGITADVRLLDAEQIDRQLAEPGSVDLVWSWGVIHHSAHTARIIRRVGSLLKPEGRFKLMVYYMGGASAYFSIVRRYLFGFWSKRDLDDTLWADADGFTARFYTRDALSDLLLAHFDKVDIRIFGQDADVVMLPRQVRRPFLKLISNKRQIALAGHRGSMIYADASNPW